MGSKKRLKSMEDVRRYLANLVNRVESGTVAPETATKLGFLANILIRALEKGNLEERLQRLEDELLKK